MNWPNLPSMESCAVFLEREAGYTVVSLAVIVLGVGIADPALRPQSHQT